MLDRQREKRVKSGTRMSQHCGWRGEAAMAAPAVLVVGSGVQQGSSTGGGGTTAAQRSCSRCRWHLTAVGAGRKVGRHKSVVRCWLAATRHPTHRCASFCLRFGHSVRSVQDVMAVSWLHHWWISACSPCQPTTRRQRNPSVTLSQRWVTGVDGGFMYFFSFLLSSHVGRVLWSIVLRRLSFSVTLPFYFYWRYYIDALAISAIIAPPPYFLAVPVTTLSADFAQVERITSAVPGRFRASPTIIDWRVYSDRGKLPTGFHSTRLGMVGILAASRSVFRVSAAKLFVFLFTVGPSAKLVHFFPLASFHFFPNIFFDNFGGFGGKRSHQEGELDLNAQFHQQIWGRFSPTLFRAYLFVQLLNVSTAIRVYHVWALLLRFPSTVLIGKHLLRLKWSCQRGYSLAFHTDDFEERS